ncbi:hypothetical protein TNCV_1896731 [Trichonephila clavipes]|nr:hypothetical protein TNCV_1896731 [Trichonephila clavipes]
MDLERPEVTLGIAFQAFITAEVSACSEEGRFGWLPSMCEWNSYSAGREMGLPRNVAIELGVQHYPECPHASQSSCFQSQELTDQTTRNKQPHTIMLPPYQT